MKKMRQMLAMLVAGVMVVSLAACGNSASTTESNDAASNTTSEAGETVTNDTPLVIACQDMSEKFSEFFASSVPDQNVADMTGVALITNDRAGQIIMNGIEGETHEYNGTEYTYYGLADVTVTENADGTVAYDFKLREDVNFSDGVNLTADDVIFSMYTYIDPTFDGGASMYALPIVGLDEYRAGTSTLLSLFCAAGRDNTDFTYFTEEQQNQFWSALDAAGETFANGIVEACIGYGLVSDMSEVALAAENWGFGGLAEDATAADFFQMIGDAYGWDVEAMEAEAGTVGLVDSLPEDVQAMIKVGVATGDSADYVAGIEKTGDYSVRVTLSELDATAIYQLGIAVQPLHYYGDADAYDYDAHNFGFTKGDLSLQRAKTTQPLGAGPYVFDKYENKIVYMTANPDYFLGAPKIANVQFKTTSEADNVPAVIQGTVDISEPSISKDALAQISGENSNGELDGDKLTVRLVDYRGYGYIGMNSQNVMVGNDAGSEESKDLRKAIATVISVYRDVVIDSYYGEAASVINYPISNTSWAAPQKSDPDYAVAFSTDVNGDPIYTEGMSEDEKYAAALDAAVGFLEAAGYTFTDGVITAAPEGAKTSYEIMIGGGGNGDHPSFGILTAASEAMKTIGFDLKINDLTDTSVLWSALEGGTAEIWCAAWSTTIDPDMFQIYHTEGGSTHYKINQPELDEMIMDARTNTDQNYRKAVYKECLDYVVDYAVEIPVYQRQECTLFSAERINVDTIVKDATSYYGWMTEINTLEMN